MPQSFCKVFQTFQVVGGLGVAHLADKSTYLVAPNDVGKVETVKEGTHIVCIFSESVFGEEVGNILTPVPLVAFV